MSHITCQHQDNTLGHAIKHPSKRNSHMTLFYYIRNFTFNLNRHIRHGRALTSIKLWSRVHKIPTGIRQKAECPGTPWTWSFGKLIRIEIHVLKLVGFRILATFWVILNECAWLQLLRDHCKAFIAYNHIRLFLCWSLFRKFLGAADHDHQSQDLLTLHHSWCRICSSGPITSWPFRVAWGHRCFRMMTFHRKETEHRELSQCFLSSRHINSYAVQSTWMTMWHWPQVRF